MSYGEKSSIFTLNSIFLRNGKQVLCVLCPDYCTDVNWIRNFLVELLKDSLEFNSVKKQYYYLKFPQDMTFVGHVIQSCLRGSSQGLITGQTKFLNLCKEHSLIYISFNIFTLLQQDIMVFYTFEIRFNIMVSDNVVLVSFYMYSSAFNADFCKNKIQNLIHRQALWSTYINRLILNFLVILKNWIVFTCIHLNASVKYCKLCKTQILAEQVLDLIAVNIIFNSNILT